MSYSVIVAKRALRISKKFFPVIKNLIIKELESIAENPHKTPSLGGKFYFLKSHHTYFKGVPYRIIYSIREEKKTILVYLVAKRSEVYKLLDRLFK
ncbi:MAG: type II toxin-antitoxin system RelE/ParE family toxin [Patescibacteria group bacterium]